MQDSDRTAAIQHIRPGIDRLLRKLRPEIELDSYAGIIGDDTSGRIPTLMIRAAINAHRSEHGKGKLPVVFIQGASDDEQWDKLRVAFAKRLHLLQPLDREKKLLVVTEGVTTGAAIARLGRLLSSQGFKFDVAVLDGAGIRRNPVKMQQPPMQLPQREAVDLLLRMTSDPTRFGATRETLRLFEEVIHDRYFPVRELHRFLDRVERSGLTRERISRLRGKGSPRQDVTEAQAAGMPLEEVDSLGWPISTRHFAGEQNAHAVRDKVELTGIRQDKFVDAMVIRGDPVVRAGVQETRRTISEMTSALRMAMEFRREEIPSILTGMVHLLRQLSSRIRADQYSVIIGDDTSGRIPALMVARAINAYRTSVGLPKLPVRFVEGTSEQRSKGQSRAFGKFDALFAGLDPSKKALIVTESISGGKSVASILEQCSMRGVCGDIATLGGSTTERLASFVSEGRWPEGTRGFSGGGSTSCIMNRPDLSGLRQDLDKFSNNKAVREARHRTSINDTRKDIASSTTELVSAIVSSYTPKLHGIEDMARDLAKVMDKYKRTITSGKVGIIVGEEQTRLATLFVARMINAYNAAHGLPRVPTVFLPVEWPEGKTGIGGEVLDSIQKRHHALLVTPDIGERIVLHPLLKAFVERSVVCDVVSGVVPRETRQWFVDRHLLAPSGRILVGDLAQTYWGYGRRRGKTKWFQASAGRSDYSGILAANGTKSVLKGVDREFVAPVRRAIRTTAEECSRSLI
ncbi:MAG: hypothetical protein ACP5OR_09035 [Candidatus Dormibacteria bacterium]